MELSDEGLDIRGNLDQASALEIVTSNIVMDSTQKGVCASTNATGVPDPAKLEVGVFEPMFTYSCHGFQDGATVKVMAHGLKSLFIQVNAAREHKLIAALSYLSPEAKLRSRR